MPVWMYCLASLATLAFGPFAAADPGEPTTEIRYQIHADPADPDSAVTHDITLSLSAVDADGDWVGYEVTAVTIARLDASGAVEAEWKEEYPVVAEPDGLWWVEHANFATLNGSDFTDPPLLVGVASAMTPEADDMVYDLVGTEPAPGKRTSPWSTTARLTYTLQVVTETDPEAEGEEEPAEVFGGQE